MELFTDPDRIIDHEKQETGIYVRARNPTLPGYGTYDIRELTRDSLKQWLRSRGGENEFAENTVLLLLGYTP